MSFSCSYWDRLRHVLLIAMSEVCLKGHGTGTLSSLLLCYWPKEGTKLTSKLKCGEVYFAHDEAMAKM